MKNVAAFFWVCMVLLLSIIESARAHRPGENEAITYIWDGADCQDVFGEVKAQILDFEREEEALLPVTALGLMARKVYFQRLGASTEKEDSSKEVLTTQRQPFYAGQFLGYENFIGRYIKVKYLIQGGRVKRVEGVFSYELMSAKDLQGEDSGSKRMVMQLFKIKKEDLEGEANPVLGAVPFDPIGKYTIKGLIFSVESLRPDQQFIRKGTELLSPLSCTQYTLSVPGKGRLSGDIESRAKLNAQVFYILDLPAANSADDPAEASLSLKLDVMNNELVGLNIASAKVIFRKNNQSKSILEKSEQDDVAIEHCIAGELPPNQIKQYDIIRSKKIAVSRLHIFKLSNLGKPSVCAAYRFTNNTDRDLPYGKVRIQTDATKVGYFAYGDIENNVKQGSDVTVLHRSGSKVVAEVQEDSTDTLKHVAVRSNSQTRETLYISHSENFESYKYRGSYYASKYPNDKESCDASHYDSEKNLFCMTLELEPAQEVVVSLPVHESP